jgi:hypothetical protein
VKTKSNIWIFALVLALIGGMFLLIWVGQPKESVSWHESYMPYDKNPYGTYVMYELLKNKYTDSGFYEININLDDYFGSSIQDSVSNYIFIGNWYFMDFLQFYRLRDFVKAGNTATIILNTPGDFLYYFDEYLPVVDFSSSIYKDKISANYLHPALQKESSYDYIKRNRTDTLFKHWPYFKPDKVDNNDSTGSFGIGSFNDTCYNFIGFNWGKGKLMIHSTPIAFTNYYLKDSLYLGYFESMLGHFNSGPVYFDMYNLYPHNSYQKNQQGINQGDSIFQFILNKPGLRWGWYLFLASILLYIVFRSKRKQRIIPVLPTKENTSLEYVETIGALYFQQKDHRKLALKEMKNVMAYIHRTYHLTGKEMDGRFIKKLSAKTGISESLLQKIKNEHHWIKQSEEISEERLTDFYRLLNHIYKIEEHG